MVMDSASHHRGAGVFALAFAAAAVTSLAGIFAIDVLALRIAPLVVFGTIPDSTWPAQWLPGAVSAAWQQNAAVQQWMNVILIFGALTAAIACINALIGFVSHANERRYETALRGLLGASPAHIRRALRRDAILNAIFGGTTGIVAGTIVAVALRRMLNAESSVLNAWPLLALAVCFAVAGYASRIAAGHLKRTGWMGDALAPESRTIPGFGAEDLRALLTTAQLACAVALTIVSVLVWSYASTAAGSASITTTDRYVARAHGSHEQVLAAVRAAGSHGESIASPGALLGIGKVDRVVSDCGRCVRANMYAPMFTVETQYHVVGTDFFSVAGIPIRHGREFATDSNTPRAVVVNETFARHAFQGQHAVGKRILVGGFENGTWYRVIGVVADVRIEGLHFLEPEPGSVSDPVRPGYAPAIYFSAAEHAPSEFDVIVRLVDKPATLAGLSFEPLARMIARAREPQNLFARVLTVLGALLGGAAVLGSFTAMMLSVNARRMEIALRRAVGARRADVRRLVYARVIAVTLRGIAVGVVVSIALTRALEVFVPGLPAFDVRIAAGIGSAFFVVALLAAVLPLRSALRIAPAQTHT
jgi:putative ABC transport system permease protein